MNTSRSLFIAVAILILAAAILFPAPTANAIVKVGLGDTIITPPIGMAMSGYARTKPSDGVHDDLHARSLVVEGDNGETTVLMTLGIINISRNYFDTIRESVNKATGIPVKNIIISCTHTHSGPTIGGPDDPYTKTLIDRSIESAVTLENRVLER